MLFAEKLSQHPLTTFCAYRKYISKVLSTLAKAVFHRIYETTKMHLVLCKFDIGIFGVLFPLIAIQSYNAFADLFFSLIRYNHAVMIFQSDL